MVGDTNANLNIEVLSIKGTSEWNEDALIMHEEAGVYGVLDGATSVVPFRGPQGETGGYLASNLVKEILESISVERWQQLTLREAVKEANMAMRNKMIEYGIDPEDKEQVWTTGIAMIRIRQQSIEFIQAGDCMIYALYRDGSIRAMTRDQLAMIDLQTLNRMKKYVDQGVTSNREMRKLIEPVIRQNKAKMNTLEGYAALSGHPEVANLLEYGVFNRIQLAGILIITDGLFPYSESESTRVDEQLLWAGVLEHGLHGYAQQLIDLEEADPECQRFIRFKTSDDKTAVWIRFSQFE